jgi:hypothetical protein
MILDLITGANADTPLARAVGFLVFMIIAVGLTLIVQYFYRETP